MVGEEKREKENEDSPDRNVSSHSEVLRVQDLVGRGVVENRLGVDTSLVGEGTPSGDVVVAEGKKTRTETEMS